jgi:membrane-bound metal-dependent hydrolase YbcI (DUF457 family)
VINLNIEEHAIAGALSSLVLYGLYKFAKQEQPTLKGAIGSLLLGGLGGAFPDILEPAEHPQHRGLFHSETFLRMLIAGNQKVWASETLMENNKLLFSLFSVAYGSHLALDSTTSKGLPLLFPVRS